MAKWFQKNGNVLHAILDKYVLCGFALLKNFLK